MGKVASMNPDNMLQGGLQDDFDGVIRKVRFVPWNYGGKIEGHVLAVAVDIEPDAASGEKPFTQHYSAGDLDLFVPTMDGDNPAPGLEHYGEEGNDDDAAEGVFALQVGKKSELSNSSNWADFLMKALDAGFPKDRLDASVAKMFEGVLAHFNRVPQKKRSGLVKAAPVEGVKNRNNDLLVITEFKGFEAGTGGVTKKGGTAPTTPSAGSTKTTAPASSPATAAGLSDLDTALVPLVEAAVKAAGDDGLSKSKLPAVALKGLAAALKGKGVKRIVEAEFLSAHEERWYFDAETGTLMATGE